MTKLIEELEGLIVALGIILGIFGFFSFIILLVFILLLERKIGKLEKKLDEIKIMIDFLKK